MVNVEYLIVSVAALAISSYFIYIIANKLFNIKLRIKPLLFCACCSLFLSIFLPRLIIGSVGITGTMVVLILCALVFSYIITYHRDAEELAVNPMELATSIIEQEQLYPVLEEIIQIKSIAIDPQNLLPDNPEQQAGEQSSLILEYNCNKIEAVPLTKLLLEQPPSSIATISPKNFIPEQLIELDINSFKSLDDLLDYAFIQKDSLQLTTALRAFQRALTLCQTNEVAPLIIVEISNIFKARGQYEEALQLFSDGRSLPALLDNRLLNQQFSEMVAFLRIIKNNLLTNKLGMLPYDKIPADLMLDINEEFRDWLTLNSIKPRKRRIIEE